MNLAHVSTQLLYTTLPIWVSRSDGSSTFGTSFLFSMTVPGQQNAQLPLLVTCRHVLVGGERAHVEFVGRAGDLPNRMSRVRVEMPGEILLRYSDEVCDLAVIPIGGVVALSEAKGLPVFFRTVSQDLVPSEKTIEDLAALEEVVFIGYPSRLIDSQNATPIMRRGITASPVWNDFGGQPVFLIDAGVFPGSSGSPVFILNEGTYATPDGVTVGRRLLLLGVLSDTLLRTEPDKSNVYLGLGKVTKASRLMDLAEIALKHLLTTVSKDK